MFEEYKDVATSGGNSSDRFIKGAEFSGGLTMNIRGFEKYTPTNPKFGATMADSIVKKGILKPGETFRYTFTVTKDEGDGFGEITRERIFDSKSIMFFNALRAVNPQEGDSLTITRTGMGMTTKYEVKKN